jgi:hypothetical protein
LGREEIELIKLNILLSLHVKKGLIMNTQHIKLNVPLTFNQMVDIVRQLSPQEKLKLKKVLQESQDMDEYDIPEEHKNIVRERMKASQEDPSRLLNWEEAKHKLKV